MVIGQITKILKNRLIEYISIYEITTTILILLFVYNLLPYIAGRLSFIPMTLIVSIYWYAYFPSIVVISFLFYMMVRYLKNHWRITRPSIQIFRSMTLLLLGLALIIGVFYSQQWEIALMYGIRDRFKSKVNVAAICEWAAKVETLEARKYKSENKELIEFDPKGVSTPIKEFQPMFVFLTKTPEGNYVEFGWGGGPVGHWGIAIGPANMKIPFNPGVQKIIVLNKGSYVWFNRQE